MSYYRPAILIFISIFDASKGAGDVCTNTTVSALSSEAALFTALHCTYSVRTLVYTAQADIDLSVGACLNQISRLDPVNSPIATSQCRLCYQGLVTDLLSLTAGKMVLGVFTPTTSTLSLACTSLSTPSGREGCYKHPDVVPVLLTFQKCAGYSIVYPATADLVIRRKWYRADIVQNMLQLGLGLIKSLPPSLAQLTNVINTPPTSQDILNLQMCYLMFVADLAFLAGKLNPIVRADCASADPTDKCFSDEVITVTMGRFSKCSGFQMNEFPIGCTNSTMVTDVLHNYDVLGTAIPMIQTNYPSNLNWFFDSMVKNITNFTTPDCAQCFRELAVDIQSNILYQQSVMPESVFQSLLSTCKDPHTPGCLGLIGISGLNNFQQCSGIALNITELKTTTPAPTVIENTTSPTTTPDTEVSGFLQSVSPSAILLSFSVVVALAF